jgi:hypothetical protein
MTDYKLQDELPEIMKWEYYISISEIYVNEF